MNRGGSDQKKSPTRIDSSVTARMVPTEAILQELARLDKMGRVCGSCCTRERMGVSGMGWNRKEEQKYPGGWKKKEGRVPKSDHPAQPFGGPNDGPIPGRPLTKSKQRPKNLTADEQEILNEVNSIIQSMRRIMHQSG
ncbi:hypothetical protein Tco_1061082 [Tanacetum coccineum]